MPYSIPNAGGAIDTETHFPFDARVVRILLAVLCLILASCAGAPPQPYQVEKPQPLPVALDQDFEFRKVLQYFLDPTAKPLTGQVNAAVSLRARLPHVWRGHGARSAPAFWKLF